MTRFISLRFTRRLVFLAFGFTMLGLASAQYYGGNPYVKPRPEPTRSMSRPAQNFGGFGGNPYARSSMPPTGMPIGSTHSYFGRGAPNPMASRAPKQKPFSNVGIPGPLVTSRQAAQIEVARGLWYGGGF